MRGLGKAYVFAELIPLNSTNVSIILYCHSILANVLHVYYMCDTCVINVWCFRCITYVIHTPVIYV